MKEKTCSKCKKTKLVSEFGTASPNNDGYNSWCKQCVRDASKKHRETPSGIYSNLKSRITYQLKHTGKNHKGYAFASSELKITRPEFVSWYRSQSKTCVYCDIPEESLRETGDLYNKATTRLTIDRIDNNGDYENGNIVLACSRCNSIKSDIFSFDEMRRLAQMFIKPKWVGSKQ